MTLYVLEVQFFWGIPAVSITISAGPTEENMAFFADGAHLISFSLPMTMAYISSTMFKKMKESSLYQL